MYRSVKTIMSAPGVCQCMNEDVSRVSVPATKTGNDEKLCI